MYYCSLVFRPVDPCIVQYAHMYLNGILNPPLPSPPSPSVQELMQEEEDLAAQLQQVHDEVVDLRQQFKAAFEEQKQAEATREKMVRGGGRVHHWHTGGSGVKREGWQHHVHTCKRCGHFTAPAFHRFYMHALIVCV